MEQLYRAALLRALLRTKAITMDEFYALLH